MKGGEGGEVQSDGEFRVLLLVKVEAFNFLCILDEADLELCKYTFDIAFLYIHSREKKIKESILRGCWGWIKSYPKHCHNVE